MAPLIRSVIIQAHDRITSDLEAPVHGNLQTFYYRHPKPVLSHITDDDDLLTDPHDTMIHKFRDLVLEHRLFQHRDFDFTDENWENRRIGDIRPSILVFAEKTGWVRFLRELHTKWGISTLALSGVPSALTSKYTATAILDQNNENVHVHPIGIVDFDPDGHIIAEAFARQLRAAGLIKNSLQIAINHRFYSEEEKRVFRSPFSRAPNQQTKIKRWLNKTDGLGGEAYGLEAESVPIERVSAQVNRLISEIDPSLQTQRTESQDPDSQ